MGSKEASKNREKEDKLVAARLIQATVRSFFEYHDRVIRFKRVDRIRRVRKKIAYEVVPSRDQIYTIADAFKKQGKMRIRNKAIILCLFQSGVRVHCLLNWRVSMVQEQLYPEIKVPIRLKITNQIDTKLSSYGLSYYYTFLQVEAAQALRDYLDYRISLEGGLRDNDFIFKSIFQKRARNERMGEVRVLRVVTTWKLS